ncbi:plasmid stability protein StbB, partial [Pseudomonas syringae pv. tagetis]
GGLDAFESCTDRAEKLGLVVELVRGDVFRVGLMGLILEVRAIIDVGSCNVDDLMWILEEFDDAY